MKTNCEECGVEMFAQDYDDAICGKQFPDVCQRCSVLENILTLTILCLLTSILCTGCAYCYPQYNFTLLSCAMGSGFGAVLTLVGAVVVVWRR